MAYINYLIIGNYELGSEFFFNVSAKKRVNDIIFNHLKIKVNDTYKKDEKIKTILDLLIQGIFLKKHTYIQNVSKQRSVLRL